jgi:hypothetical protein
VGPRAGLDTEATGRILSPLPGIEPRSPGGPARSHTLFSLSYPAHTRHIDGGVKKRNNIQRSSLLTYTNPWMVSTKNFTCISIVLQCYSGFK